MPDLNERVATLEERTSNIQGDVKEIKETQAELLRCMQSIRDAQIRDKSEREGERRTWAKVAGVAGLVASGATTAILKLLGH
jgi:hypothetical protein